MTCEVEGCDKPRRGKHCRMHAERLRRYGSLDRKYRLPNGFCLHCNTPCVGAYCNKTCQVRLWRDNNESLVRKRSRDYAAVRRARLIGQEGYVPKGFLEAMKRVYGYQCAKCESTKRVEIDHVIPLAVGGIDELSNYQFLCRNCNAQKSTKIADYRTSILVDTYTT
jgi:5-methylcytosine-specific restriction endonuclease McrA